MFFQLYHNREGHSDDPKPMFERNRFYLRYQAPIATRKKKSVQCWKEPKWFLETETQINKSQLKATGRTWTLLGQYYCLQSSVILSSKKKLLDFLRSHGSLVTTETNRNPNSFLFCIRNARGSYLMGTSADQLGHYRHTAECKPSVFIKVSPLSKVVNTTKKYTDCCHL